MALRYLELPQVGTSAFTATAASSSTAEFNGQNLIYGSPGSRPVYSPRPAGMSDGELGGPLNQPSSCSPDVIYPSIYFVIPNDTMHAPVDMSRRSPTPIPATPVSNVAATGFMQPRIGGDTVTPAIRPFTRWKTY